MRLLVVRGDAQRLANRLPQPEYPLQLLELESDGSITANGRKVPVGDVHPLAAWLSLDVFARGLLDSFVSLLDAAVGLRWLHTVHAGLDLPIYAKLLARGVRVSHSHAQAPAIAEFVLGQVLAVFQQHERIRKAQRECQWATHPFRELASSRWLIVGLGNAGLAIAGRARALGATVSGITRRDLCDPLFDKISRPDQLLAELPRADVIVLACPLTSATQDLVGSSFLAAMKDDSILVNIARGGLVDEWALIESLDIGRPAYAILDVTRAEPLPLEHPFWKHERVLLTAHSAFAGSGTGARNDELFIANLRRYLEGEPLLHEVTVI